RRSRHRAGAAGVAHLDVEIDVGRAAAMALAVEGGRRQVDAGIDAAASAEALEPQDSLVAGQHGIELGRPWQEEVSANDVAQHIEHLADHPRLSQPALEEVRLRVVRVARRERQLRQPPPARLHARGEGVLVGKVDRCGHIAFPGGEWTWPGGTPVSLRQPVRVYYQIISSASSDRSLEQPKNFWNRPRSSA